MNSPITICFAVKVSEDTLDSSCPNYRVGPWVSCPPCLPLHSSWKKPPKHWTFVTLEEWEIHRGCLGSSLPGQPHNCVHSTCCCCCCSVFQSCLTLQTSWTAAHQAPLSFTVSWSLLNFTSIESVMLSNHLILSCSHLLLSSILPSIRVFSNELALHIRWPKYRSFGFSISPSKEYSQLISFRIDWSIHSLVSVQNRICVGGMLGPCCFPRHPSLQEMRHRCCLLQASKHTWGSRNSTCPLDPLT